jgi:hypothetical protein
MQEWRDRVGPVWCMQWRKLLADMKDMGDLVVKSPEHAIILAFCAPEVCNSFPQVAHPPTTTPRCDDGADESACWEIAYVLYAPVDTEGKGWYPCRGPNLPLLARSGTVCVVVSVLGYVAVVALLILTDTNVDVSTTANRFEYLGIDRD